LAALDAGLRPNTRPIKPEKLTASTTDHSGTAIVPSTGNASTVIEASAGTGKTWTIAALYLRLVLGHGGDAAFARPLAPAEVLVMTFTRAATRELSDRIRSRLLEAARCFRGEASPQPGDAFLAELDAVSLAECAYPPAANAA